MQGRLLTHSVVRLATLLALATAILLTADDLDFIQTASAQQTQQINPAGAAEMAYASLQETTLFMQGGYNTDFADVFYSFDLTQDSWSVLSPPWTLLPPPSVRTVTNPRTTIANGMTVTKNHTQLILCAEPGVFVHDIATRTWKSTIVDSCAICSFAVQLSTGCDPWRDGTGVYSWRCFCRDKDGGVRLGEVCGIHGRYATAKSSHRNNYSLWVDLE